MDRQGNEETLGAEPRAYRMLQLSPDGHHVALAVGDIALDNNMDIWVYDLARNVQTRLTFDPAADAVPVWTPSGDRILFTSARNSSLFSGLYAKAADGSGDAESVMAGPTAKISWHVTPDGKRLLFAEIVSDTGAYDLGMLSLDGLKRDMLLESESSESMPRVSPDGRWLAYVSDESGQRQVYVRPFPNVDDGRWQISSGFGVAPVWGPDGRELFFQTTADAGGTRMMTVPIESGGTFRPGRPVALFQGPFPLSAGLDSHAYDVSPDGQRFLMVREQEGADPSAGLPRLVVLQNWHEELKARVPIN